MATSKGHTPRAGQFGHTSRSASHREQASRGGRKAHQLGTAHEFTSEEAAAAGRKASRGTVDRATVRESADRQQRIVESLARHSIDADASVSPSRSTDGQGK